jgi:hypothetical protein
LSEFWHFSAFLQKPTDLAPQAPANFYFAPLCLISKQKEKKYVSPNDVHNNNA